MSVHSIKLTPTSAIRTGLPLVIAVLVSLAVFSGALVELGGRWSRQEEYSHGFLIPVVAAWMLWARREAVVASLGEPSWTGIVAVFVAAIMLIVGELSAFFLLSQLGFVVALLGIVLSLGGTS